jgi:2'-hydroxyisoflavone reductase
MGREILVIGGTGFIGNEILRALQSSDDRITILNRGNVRITEDFRNVTSIIGDRNNPPAELGNQTFDTVIDTCGFKPEDFTIASTVNFQHYIFISSVSVYSNDLAMGQTESAKKINIMDMEKNLSVINKHQRYGLMKLLSEIELRKTSKNISIVRPSIVLGKNENTGRLNYLRSLNQPQCKIPFQEGRKFQFIDVEDLANLIKIVMDKIPGSDYNLVGPSLDWNEFVAVFLKSFHIIDYTLVSQVTDFPFWDIENNAGMRTLTSEFDWIVNYPFTSLQKSFSNYLMSV